jgi:hypothetical protein
MAIFLRRKLRSFRLRRYIRVSFVASLGTHNAHVYYDRVTIHTNIVQICKMGLLYAIVVLFTPLCAYYRKVLRSGLTPSICGQARASHLEIYENGIQTKISHFPDSNNAEPIPIKDRLTNLLVDLSQSLDGPNHWHHGHRTRPAQ